MQGDWLRVFTHDDVPLVSRAVNHLPEEITGEYSKIAWPHIRCFRNILVLAQSPDEA